MINPARRVFSAEDRYYLLSGSNGRMVSGVLSGLPWGAIGGANFTVVEPAASGGVIYAITANSLTLEGQQLDLRGATVPLDATIGTWSSGEWYASLVTTSIAGSTDLMRVCWNLNLPPPPPITGPPGVEPVVRAEPFKRLMCGVYPRSGSPNVGGYLIDDFGGTIRTFTGSW